MSSPYDARRLARSASAALSDALEYLDNLSTESGDNPTLLREVASAYQKVGDIQGNPYYSNFGDMESALRSYQKVLAIREKLAASDPLDQRFRFDLSGGYGSVADIEWAQGDYKAALESYLKSLSIIEALAAEDPGNRSNQQTLAARHYSVGQTLRKLGDAPRAIASFQKSLETDQALLAVEPENQTYRHGIATKSVKIGDVYFDAENYAEALLHHQKGVEIFELLARNKDDSVSQRIYALFLNRVASDKQGLGDPASAIDLNLKAVAILKPLLDADPQNEQYRFDMATFYKSLGSAYLGQNRLDIAIDFLKKAVAIFTESLKNNRDREAQEDLAITYKHLGDCFTKAGRYAEAKEAYLESNKAF